MASHRVVSRVACCAEVLAAATTLVFVRFGLVRFGLIRFGLFVGVGVTWPFPARDRGVYGVPSPTSRVLCLATIRSRAWLRRPGRTTPSGCTRGAVLGGGGCGVAGWLLVAVFLLLMFSPALFEQCDPVACLTICLGGDANHSRHVWYLQEGWGCCVPPVV